MQQTYPNLRLMPRGIRVNAIAPGPMDTPFFYPQEEKEAVEFHKSQALGGRLTDIKDIAPLVDYLVNDKWITGQVLFCKFFRCGGADISQRRLHHPLDSSLMYSTSLGPCSLAVKTEMKEIWIFADCSDKASHTSTGDIRTTRCPPPDSFHRHYLTSPTHPSPTMSRDPPPESRYYRERDENERRATHFPNQRPEVYNEPVYEEVDYADCGHYAEYVDYSDAEPEHHPVYEKPSSYTYAIPKPQPVPVPQPVACPEKAALATGLPLPTSTGERRRSRIPSALRTAFLWCFGALSLLAYIVSSSYKPFSPLPSSLPFTSPGTPASSSAWPAQFGVPSLPKDYVKKCHDLLEPPKGTFTDRLDKLGSKLDDTYVFVAEPGTTASYYLGGFGPGSWSRSERPFLVAVNSTGDVTILTPRFEEARARLEKLPKEVQKRATWVAWEESESPFVKLSAYFGRPSWVLDSEVRAFIADGLLRLGPQGPDERKEADRIRHAVVAIRERQDKREVELLRCANQFTLHAIRKTRSRMKLGITEGQTRKILYEEMKATGLKDYSALVLFGGEFGVLEA